MPLETVKDWLGRKVRINEEGPADTHGEVGTVLAVDDTPWQPSAWIRVHEDHDYPAYRSVNLFWLTDLETCEQGPVWGTNGPKNGIGNRSDGTFRVDELWETDVVASDSVAARTVISYIANLMYSASEYPSAAQRYDKLMADGGPFMRAIEEQANERVRQLEQPLTELRMKFVKRSIQKE